MPWQNQGGGGGPWGGGRGGGGGGNGGDGPRNNSPWGGNGGGGRGPSGGGPQGPDFEELLRRSQSRFRQMMPGGFGSLPGIALVAVVILVAWVILGNGIFTVKEGFQGIKLVFGERSGTPVAPGLGFNFPAPIGDVERASVQQERRVEIGFEGTGTRRRDRVEESLMLTGDENIIKVQFVVIWQLYPDQVADYLFNVESADRAVKAVAESVMREIIGQTEFEYARTKGRTEIQRLALEKIQQTLTDYGTGIRVTSIEMQQIDPPQSVMEAFRDVQAARADKERIINEATAYAYEQLESAQGDATRIIREAEAYKTELVQRAQGEASRFAAILREYRESKSIVARRLFLETLEDVWGRMDKVLIEGDGQGQGAVPYLSLNELRDQMQRRNARNAQEDRRNTSSDGRSTPMQPLPTTKNQAGER